MTIVLGKAKAKAIRAKSQFEKVLKNLLKLKLFVCWLVWTKSSKTSKFSNKKFPFNWFLRMME